MNNTTHQYLSIYIYIYLTYYFFFTFFFFFFHHCNIYSAPSLAAVSDVISPTRAARPGRVLFNDFSEKPSDS